MTAWLRGLGLSGAFVSVTTLFFVWGFISSNNDPLIVTLRAAFGLGYTQGLAVQLVSFVAFGLMSLPAAWLSERLGLLRAILLALLTMIGACLLLRMVLPWHSYGAILLALFVLAVGVNMLQVAANPLAAALGPAQTSHFRLSLAQAFNSLGVVMGAHFGSRIMLGDRAMVAHPGGLASAADRTEALGAVSYAYGVMTLLLLALLAFLWLQRARITAAAAGIAPAPQSSVFAALHSRWAVAGAVAIGLYVGAEVSIGSVMINFLHQPGVLNLPFERGGELLANLYWGGALVGRFIGAALLTRVPAPRLLAINALCAAALCLLALGGQGAVAGYAALAVGLFNSIMFPTIFTITLERSGVSQSSTSGLLCLAIVGGAILPLLVGLMADTMSLSASFVVPAVAYLFITWFAWRAISARIFGSGASDAPAFH